MIDAVYASQAAIRICSLLKFAPTTEAGIKALVEVLLAFVDTREHMDWLVTRILQRYDDWPGPKTLRAEYCSKWQPKDGVEASLEDAT